jgi:hypothetical protein
VSELPEDHANRRETRDAAAGAGARRARCILRESRASGGDTIRRGAHSLYCVVAVALLRRRSVGGVGGFSLEEHIENDILEQRPQKLEAPREEVVIAAVVVLAVGRRRCPRDEAVRFSP